MIYLDNAATTFPKPQSVVDEVARCMTTYCGNPGRGSHKMSLAASEAIFEAREKLSSLVGADDPDNCIFTLNTTYALNIAVKSIVRRGYHIIISDMEHNSVYRQIAKLKEDGIATFDVFGTFGGDADLIIKDIKRKMTQETKLLVCQISSNICPLTMPVNLIGKLCRTEGIRFIADAAQSAGINDINVKDMAIDALCVPSHKGLYGPQGAGAVVISERMEDLRTLVEGGSGSNSLDKFMPQELPDRLEAGTLPTPAIAGLSRGIDFINSVGLSNIRQHEFSLASMLTEELRSDKRFVVYGDCMSGGIVLFNVVGMTSNAVSRELDNRGICTRAGFHCAPLAHKTLSTGPDGAVRVSFGIFNDKCDVSSLLDALLKITK